MFYILDEKYFITVTTFNVLFRPPLIEMLFIIICMHWKLKWIIPAFKLVIFYCLTTFCNIKFFKYFSLYCLFLCHFWLLFKIFYLKGFISFFNETKYSLHHLSRKIYWCIMLRGVCTEEDSWRLMLFLNTCYTSSMFLCVLKEKFQK